MRTFFKRIDIDIKYYSLHIKTKVKLKDVLKDGWGLSCIFYQTNYIIKLKPKLLKKPYKIEKFLETHDFFCEINSNINAIPKYDKLFISNIKKKDKYYKVIYYIQDKL